MMEKLDMFNKLKKEISLDDDRLERVVNNKCTDCLLISVDALKGNGKNGANDIALDVTYLSVVFDEEENKFYTNIYDSRILYNFDSSWNIDDYIQDIEYQLDNQEV